MTKSKSDVEIVSSPLSEKDLPEICEAVCALKDAINSRETDVWTAGCRVLVLITAKRERSPQFPLGCDEYSVDAIHRSNLGRAIKRALKILHASLTSYRYVSPGGEQEYVIDQIENLLKVAKFDVGPPEDLTQAQHDIWEVVVESGGRQSRARIGELLAEKQLGQGVSILKHNLAILSRRLKVLPYRSDTKRRGYGPPGWQ